MNLIPEDTEKMTEKERLHGDFNCLLQMAETFWNFNESHNGDKKHARAQFDKSLETFISQHFRDQSKYQEDHHLMAYALQKFFQQNLQNIGQAAKEIPATTTLLKIPVIQGIEDRINTMQNEKRMYLQISDNKPTYCIPEPISNNHLANTILHFSTRQLAHEINSTSEMWSNLYPDLRAEPFTNPDDEKPGIWISKKGEKYDPEHQVFDTN